MPVTALQEVDGKPRIWVIDAQSKTVSPRDITVISRTDSTVVLAGGVKNGERVVSAGVNSLKPGQQVKIDEDSQ
ncbi:multidrug efflux system subunit MdtA [compost metagenome]